MQEIPPDMIFIEDENDENDPNVREPERHHPAELYNSESDQDHHSEEELDDV